MGGNLGGALEDGFGGITGGDFISSAILLSTTAVLLLDMRGSRGGGTGGGDCEGGMGGVTSLLMKGECGRGGTGGTFSSCNLLLVESVNRGERGGGSWSLRWIRGGTVGSMVTGGGRGGFL